MGAYNEVQATIACPWCRALVTVAVQFKYASVVHHLYRLSDTLIWGVNDVGPRDAARVVVDGEAESCPACGYDSDWAVDIHVVRNVLESAATSTGKHDFVAAGDTFLVLDENPRPRTSPP